MLSSFANLYCAQVMKQGKSYTLQWCSCCSLALHMVGEHQRVALVVMLLLQPTAEVWL